MALRMSAVVVTLLVTLPVADLARMTQAIIEEREQLVNQAQNAAQNLEEALESVPIRTLDGTDPDSAGAFAKGFEAPAALIQDADSQATIFSSAFGAEVRKRPSAVPNEHPSNRPRVQSARKPRSRFSKIFDYVKSAGDHSRITILKAACDSNVFSCKEIMQFANNSLAWDPPGAGAFNPLGPSRRWLNVANLFAEGRDKTGCISDPANAKSIVDLFEQMWPAISYPLEVGSVLTEHLAILRLAFIRNPALHPAKGIKLPRVQLQTNFRTDDDMDHLLIDMGRLQLMQVYAAQGSRGFYVPASPAAEEFESWLKQIRAQGEQFSGPQLLSLVDAIPKTPLGGPDRNAGTSEAVSVLLQYLEQYVAGVTCEVVKQIINQMDRGGDVWIEDLDANFHVFLLGLDALKPSIVDGENKVDIVAFADSMYYNTNYPIIGRTAKLLRDVGVGMPPRNNPIFGVVNGNPVIFVIDGSNSMDERLALANNSVTRRELCNSQLETVLEGLPDGTYFNVIKYSSSAVKVFQKAMLANQTSIDAAIEAVTETCRGAYRPGQDPAEMLRSIQAFALNFKHQLGRSPKKRSMEALQLAYDMEDTPLDGADDQQHTLNWYRELNMNRNSPQIYFLTSGLPDGGARQTLDSIDELDRGRNIPVNSIALITPADNGAKQFIKDLGKKTGGFVRSVEQTLAHTKKRKREEIENQANAL